MATLLAQPQKDQHGWYHYRYLEDNVDVKVRVRTTNGALIGLHHTRCQNMVRGVYLSTGGGTKDRLRKQISARKTLSQ
jgi:hypothetical protein